MSGNAPTVTPGMTPRLTAAKNAGCRAAFQKTSNVDKSYRPWLDPRGDDIHRGTIEPAFLILPKEG